MTLDQAKTALATYRPWADAAESDFAEPLATVRQSAEGQRWFAAHCETQLKIHAQFRHIPVPAGLKEQILSEAMPEIEPALAGRKRWLLVAAVGAVVGALLVGLLLLNRSGPGEQLNLAGFRTR